MSGLPNNATVEMEELSAEEMEVAAKREVSCRRTQASVLSLYLMY